MVQGTSQCQELLNAQTFPWHTIRPSSTLQCDQALMWLLRKFKEKKNTHACMDALVKERTWLSTPVLVHSQDFCLMTSPSRWGIPQPGLRAASRMRWLWPAHGHGSVTPVIFNTATDTHTSAGDASERFCAESKITRQIPVAQPAVWCPDLGFGTNTALWTAKLSHFPHAHGTH